MLGSLMSDIGANLYTVLELLGYLIFAFIGSFLKELYNANNVKKYRFEAHRVISSTVVASIACWSLRAHFIDDYNYAVSAFAGFTLGLLGFEIFKNLSSIEGIKHLIRDAKEIYRLLTNFNSSVDSDEKDNDGPNIPAHDTSSGPTAPLSPSIRIHEKR